MTRCLFTMLLCCLAATAHAAAWDPFAADYTGRQGVTLYVSKLGDNSDGRTWATAYTTVQAAMDAVPDAQGGHRVIVRPDTYMEPNISVPYPGAAGSYNVLIGDVDGRLGSGRTGEVVLDSGDAEKGFKSYDWWGTLRSNLKGWSKEHTAPTYSAIVWDRWILRQLYATGGDGGLMWDCTNRIEPFTVVVEDCTSIGRAFGGGVASCLSRPDEPISFRRCNFWALDWWGDTAAFYVRVENPAMPDLPDVLIEDCTLVSPQCALKGGNYGFHTYMRVRAERTKFIALNFSQPAGTPTDGIIQSVQNGKYLHVDLEDSTLMGYKVFGVKVDKDTEKAIGYTAKRGVNAYVQFTQEVPEGMLRIGHWPADIFANIAPPAPRRANPGMSDERLVRKDMCEVSPIVWKDRLSLLACVRPASGGKREDYHLTIIDAETQEELARFGEGYSLASASVHDGTVYVTASRFEDENWNDVTLFTSRDLKEWKQEVIITQQPNEHLFNSSLCAGPNGFVLAYESNTSDFPAFTIKFAESKDGKTWTTREDAVLGTNRYTACPTIRYADGYYYVLYLEHRTPRWFFESYIARSKDLVTWYQSPANPVLSPQGVTDGINASDPDLIEHEGKTYLYYAVGDQRTWMDIKRQTYAGSEADFLTSWFTDGEGIRDTGDLAGHKERQATAQADERRAWFRDAKFGMFIHWGPFAVQGADPDAAYDYFDMKSDASLRGDYVRYGEAFDPKHYDPAEWMALAKEAGMKYAVLTSKHHDGYALFDTDYSSYDSVEQAPKADLSRAFADAARESGLKVGFYYSMLDWHHLDFDTNFGKYVDEVLFGQVKELCTKYGAIDCVWFDGEWDYPAEQWRANDLVNLIHQLQPNALVNDRLGLGARGLHPRADFYTREQPSEVNVAMGFEKQKPWEACVTMGDYWQYSVKDAHLKSDADLIRLLVDVVSRGGNLLLNVGPTPDGEIPAAQQERLRAMGAWLAKNGDSIYGTRPGPFASLPAGKCTTKGRHVYLHLESRPGDTLALSGLQNEIVKASLLDGGAELAFDQKSKTITLPATLPDARVTTIDIQLDAEPIVQ
jgi:alpha-L-fucosidase